MAKHIEFSSGTRLPVEGSLIGYGTAELRVGAGTLEGSTLIGLGSVESCSVKDTGSDEELVGESGETETSLLMDEGQEVTVTVRFTRDVAAPRKGWFIGLLVPFSSLTPLNENPATPDTNSTYPQHFLITNVARDWGNKAVRKYTLTCRRWHNIGADAVVGVVTTATGALASRTDSPVQIEPEE